jgi:hypothetical protein
MVSIIFIKVKPADLGKTDALSTFEEHNDLLKARQRYFTTR